MTTSTTKWIKRGGITMVLGILMWLSYIFYFKFIINDYKAKQIEQKLQKNFQSNHNDFKNLITFSKEIKVLGNCVFGPDDSIKFQVYDTALDRTTITGNFISVGENSSDSKMDIQFLDNNQIEIFDGGKEYVIKDWILDFDGKVTKPIVSKLLAYNGIDTTEIKTLRQMLYKINCSGFSKDDKLISLRYSGHWGEGFNYLFSLTDTLYNKNWNKLSDNFFWEHYKSPLFCGLTKW